MNKDILKAIIRERQEEILQIDIVQRPLNLEKNNNYVLIGLRRAGKSYMMFQHIQHLIKTKVCNIEDILYINFEDERLLSIKAEDLNLFLEAYKEMYNAKPIVFLDEIQNIDGWEKFARRLADSKYRIFITGSNAKMLSKEIYSTLGSRYLVKEVYPFSFSEYLIFNGIALSKNWSFSSEKNLIVKLFENYFYYGGCAEVFSVSDKRNWLNSLYQKVLLGDIIIRNGIRNDKAMRLLTKKIAESVMQPSSLSRLKNILNSSGETLARNTVSEYLGFLNDAYLIFSIQNFSDKISDKETFKKRYFSDNGLLNNLLFDGETKLLENLVALTLYRKHGDGLYYYNRNIEVDFYIPSAKQAIQVSYSISDELTKEREVKALIKMAEYYSLDSILIITRNEEFKIHESGINIDVIPVWKWLLND